MRIWLRTALRLGKNATGITQSNEDMSNMRQLPLLRNDVMVYDEEKQLLLTAEVVSPLMVHFEKKTVVSAMDKMHL